MEVGVLLSVSIVEGKTGVALEGLRLAWAGTGWALHLLMYPPCTSVLVPARQVWVPVMSPWRVTEEVRKMHCKTYWFQAYLFLLLSAVLPTPSAKQTAPSGGSLRAEPPNLLFSFWSLLGFLEEQVLPPHLVLSPPQAITRLQGAVWQGCCLGRGCLGRAPDLDSPLALSMSPKLPGGGVFKDHVIPLWACLRLVEKMWEDFKLQPPGLQWHTVNAGRLGFRCQLCQCEAMWF